MILYQDILCRERDSRKIMHSQAFLSLGHTQHRYQIYIPLLTKMPCTVGPMMQHWHSAEHGKLTSRKIHFANPSEIWTIARMLSFGDLTFTIYWATVYPCLYMHFNTWNITASLLAKGNYPVKGRNLQWRGK